MSRVLLSCVSVLALMCGCTSPSVLSSHEAGHRSVESGASEALRPFDIASADAPTALCEWSRQAEKQTLFDYAVVGTRQTRAVEGMFAPSEALRSMLKGTGLVAHNVNDHTVAITPPRSNPSTQHRSN